MPIVRGLEVDPEALHRSRIAAGLSRETIADRIGKSFATVVNYEAGRSRPASMHVVARWAAACGVTTDSLMLTAVSP